MLVSVTPKHIHHFFAAVVDEGHWDDVLNDRTRIRTSHTDQHLNIECNEGYQDRRGQRQKWEQHSANEKIILDTFFQEQSL